MAVEPPLMTHVCGDCHRTFDSELDYELHRDTCSRDKLFCRRCGERFSESGATRDGWHYSCPNDDCEAEGLGEDLVRLEEVRVGTQ